MVEKDRGTALGLYSMLIPAVGSAGIMAVLGGRGRPVQPSACTACSHLAEGEGSTGTENGGGAL